MPFHRPPTDTWLNVQACVMFEEVNLASPESPRSHATSRELLRGDNKRTYMPLKDEGDAPPLEIVERHHSRMGRVSGEQMAHVASPHTSGEHQPLSPGRHASPRLGEEYRDFLFSPRQPPKVHVGWVTIVHQGKKLVSSKVHPPRPARTRARPARAPARAEPPLPLYHTRARFLSRSPCPALASPRSLSRSPRLATPACHRAAPRPLMTSPGPLLFGRGSPICSSAPLHFGRAALYALLVPALREAARYAAEPLAPLSLTPSHAAQVRIEPWVRQQAALLWKMQQLNDRLQRHLETESALLDPTGVGFGFGGVFPGYIHAKGVLHEAHKVHFSVDRVGRYLLHVRLRDQSRPIAGSPFALLVEPGAASPMTTTLQPETEPLYGEVGLNNEDGCRLLLRTYDRTGNVCKSGEAKIVTGKMDGKASTTSAGDELVSNCLDNEVRRIGPPAAVPCFLGVLRVIVGPECRSQHREASAGAPAASTPPHALLERPLPRVPALRTARTSSPGSASSAARSRSRCSSTASMCAARP